MELDSHLVSFAIQVVCRAECPACRMTLGDKLTYPFGFEFDFIDNGESAHAERYVHGNISSSILLTFSSGFEKVCSEMRPRGCVFLMTVYRRRRVGRGVILITVYGRRRVRGPPTTMTRTIAEGSSQVSRLLWV